MTLCGHPLFQELVPAVHLAIEKFVNDHKDFKLPPQMHSLNTLANRARDQRMNPPKRSSRLSLTFRAFHQAICRATADASSPPIGPKPKKVKNSVRHSLPHSSITDFYFTKTKRVKISKEIIENSDDEGLPPIPESSAPRAEELPPLPTESISFGNSNDNIVNFLLSLVQVIVLKVYSLS